MELYCNLDTQQELFHPLCINIPVSDNSFCRFRHLLWSSKHTLLWVSLCTLCSVEIESSVFYWVSQGRTYISCYCCLGYSEIHFFTICNSRSIIIVDKCFLPQTVLRGLLFFTFGWSGSISQYGKIHNRTVQFKNIFERLVIVDSKLKFADDWKAAADFFIHIE
jgi:hypothetical protein